VRSWQNLWEWIYSLKNCEVKVSNKSAALTSLRERMMPLVIDDFHYIKRDRQGK